jgi:hypothetical protein
MSEVTHILHAIAAGDPQAASQLLPLVYDELRLLAGHRPAGRVLESGPDGGVGQRPRQRGRARPQRGTEPTERIQSDVRVDVFSVSSMRLW